MKDACLMRSEEEIEKELNIAKEQLQFFFDSYCVCGCQNDNIDYWKERIKILEWVLGKS